MVQDSYKMKNIIIAAGYATRLYPLTENFPKPLLKIGNSTILGRILSDVDSLPEIDEHIIVSNHKFAKIFKEWAENDCKGLIKPIRIIDDCTSTNETNECNVDEDIMVLAADNILDFSLKGFVDFFTEKKTSCIMFHNQPSIEKLQRTGVVVLNDNNKVLNMEEKPKEPKSNWAVPPFYIYRKEDITLIKDCMNHGCGFDAPGNLAHYLCREVEMHAWQMPGGRFDIGSLDTYEEAKLLYGE